MPGFRSSRAANEEALGLLRQAVGLDPDYATAYALAARCFQFQLMFGWRPPDDPGDGIRLAHRAIELGTNGSEALWMAALALVHLSGEIDHVLAQVERSLSLNPNLANAWTASCFVHSYLGDSATAIEHFHRAQRLNSLDLSQHVHWNTVAWDYFAIRRTRDDHPRRVRRWHDDTRPHPFAGLADTMENVVALAVTPAAPEVTLHWFAASPFATELRFARSTRRRRPGALQTQASQ